MNKTLTVIRPGESHDDYSWALKLSDAERLSIADRLLRDLWVAAHGQPYPLMDRTVVRLVKENGMRSREEKLEFKKELEARTLGFSVRVFKLLNALPKNSAMRVISYQLGKSASSIGANYREANRAESGDDFAHKISIALKEASETHYWLQVLAGLYPEHAVICELGAEAEEFLKIFQTINRTARSTRK